MTDMNYKNKLMGLSLILLAAFSACTDDVENGGRDSGTDDHRITFAVGTESPDARTRADGSLPDAAGSYETNSVEMQGKLDGKNVYLTAEVSDGLPGDDQPLTRGTQVTGGAQVDEFSVSAAILDANVFEPETLDVMYNVKVAKDNASSTWTTGTPYYWPTGKKLTFFAWYPYNSKNLTIPKDNNVKDTKLFYEIPEQVADQEDFMMANSYEVSETSSVPIFFRHMLTAVKFKTSNNIPACTVKSISLKGVKYKGYHNWQAHNSIILSWNPDADTRDFTLDFPNGKEVAENTETELTGKGETFFMMPQTFGDDSEARLEVTLVMNGVEQTLSAKLKDIMANGSGYSYWVAGTAVTYNISLDQNVELELNKDVFVASGADAVIYVKSNCDWECTLSDPNGITGSAAPALCKPTLKGSTSGVQSDSFDNENAKLTIETIQPTDTETRKGKVKLTFTFPSKPGKTVEKEVTLTSSLMVEYPTGSDIWYKLSQGSMSCHDLMTTDTPTLPDNADFATAIAKVVGANVTYSRELVATRMLNPDDNTQCFTYFGIRRATPDGSTIVVNLSRITLENYGGSTFDEKNFMTWNGTYYPVGSTWTVTKDNYDVKTHVDDMGMDVSVWQSTTMGDWGYDQAYGSGLFTFPGYYTIKNNKFGYYSIEKVSN